MFIPAGTAEKPKCKKLGQNIGWAKTNNGAKLQKANEFWLYFTVLLGPGFIENLHSKWQSVLKAEQLLHLTRPIWKPRDKAAWNLLSVWGFFCVFVYL